MNTIKIIALTYGEFQSWFNYGSICLPGKKIITISLLPNGSPDPLCRNVGQVLSQLPQLGLNDEAGVLLCEIANDIDDSFFEIGLPRDSGSVLLTTFW